MDRATQAAWEELQHHWDTAYTFSHGDKFHAIRRDTSIVLTADTPQALAELVTADYRTNHVPRDVAP